MANVELKIDMEELAQSVIAKLKEDPDIQEIVYCENCVHYREENGVCFCAGDGIRGPIQGAVDFCSKQHREAENDDKRG